MCSMSVLCPLCAQTSFSSIDALRCSLIKAANGPLACPICQELFLGLDKLTIHLFSHTNIMNSTIYNINANTTTATTTANNENIKNFEKLKTQQIENPHKINNNSNNGTDIKIQQTPFIDEVNIINNTHHVWEKNMLKMGNGADNTTSTNKSNSTRQHPQVVTTFRSDQEDSVDLERLAQCDICEFTFRNEELRNMHIRLVHQNFEYHKNMNNDGMCKSESLTGTTSTLNGNQNASMVHDFKCHLCAKTFRTKGSLRVHLKVVHLMGLPYVNHTPKLTICDRIRHKENKLLKSTNQNHNNAHELQQENVNVTSTTADFTSSNNCNLFSTSPVNFMPIINAIPTAAANISMVNVNQSPEHQQNNVDNSTTVNPNVLLVFNNSSGHAELDTSLNPATALMTITTQGNEAAHKMSSNMVNVMENPKIWECDVCSKAFTTKYFLKKHKRLHTGEMPYTCELCARTFTFQQSYHKHLLYHSDEKPHVCATCGRAFKELSTLHNHERIHSGEKPFKCEVCDKSFRQRVSFLVHTRIHTGVMPYKCELCQRSFRYKVSQRTHKCLLNLTEESTTTSPDENTIDRMSENFIKAFLETSTANQADNHLNESQNSPASNEIAAINEKASSLNEQQAILTKTIDDIVFESCNKMGIGSDCFSAEQILNEGSISPSQKLQNMRLYSPQLVTPDLNGIEGELTKFFLENSHGGSNLL